jgi:urease accessory protein
MVAATSIQSRDQIFAANRAFARIDLAVAERSGTTRRANVHESGSLRVRFPNAAGPQLEAMLVNTAGGMAGGDQFTIDIAAGERAQLLISTAAAEKVYRSLGPDTTVNVHIKAATDAIVAWLPQETILFDGARLQRRIDIELADTAQVLVAEALIFGRTGNGEVVEQGRLIDNWRIRRGGRLIHAEGIRLDGLIASKLAAAAGANGGFAIATVLLVPGDDALVATVEAMRERFAGEVAASAWNGLAAVRCCAADGAALRHDLTAILGALSKCRLPRLWNS